MAEQHCSWWRDRLAALEAGEDAGEYSDMIVATEADGPCGLAVQAMLLCELLGGDAMPADDVRTLVCALVAGLRGACPDLG
jgi:hypothetical protein